MPVLPPSTDGAWVPPSWAIPLWPPADSDGNTVPYLDGDIDQGPPSITPFLPDSSVSKVDGSGRAAVLVLPGGGYCRKAAHEGAPVAEWLASLGLVAFVLDYRVSPYRHPVPLLDARRAMRLIRSRAAEWNVDPQRVGVLGFSAGGHLAASLGTIDPGSSEEPKDEVDALPASPNAQILCYPVISFCKESHLGSVEQLLGPGANEESRDALSCELHVQSTTPPSFIWHTADDASVPLSNSLRFAEALARASVPVELHVFPSGTHGLGLAASHPRAKAWPTLCAQWLSGLGWVR